MHPEASFQRGVLVGPSISSPLPFILAKVTLDFSQSFPLAHLRRAQGPVFQEVSQYARGQRVSVQLHTPASFPDFIGERLTGEVAEDGVEGWALSPRPSPPWRCGPLPVTLGSSAHPPRRGFPGVESG